MQQKLLFISSSREGHTVKVNMAIAHQIAYNLSNAHSEDDYEVDVQVLSIEEALQYTEEQLFAENYMAVVIGASIHYGNFSPDLFIFIQNQIRWLNSIPSYFFLTCLTARKEEKAQLAKNAYWKKFSKRSMWRPRLAAIFAGALNYSQLGFWDRTIVRFIMRITGGDTDLSTNKIYTNWDKVNDFAYAIASDLDHDVQNIEKAPFVYDNELMSAHLDS